MSSSAYWDSQYNYYMNNQPPAPESYYNKSFAERINDAQKNIDNLVAEKDKSWAATQQKQDEYNTFFGNMSSYKDVYDKAENEFGVKVHQDTYEKNKKALALAESTLSALPSTINSSSNRVLTQSQREARYNALSNKITGYRDNLLARSSAYEEVWKKARENQSAYATAEISSQYSKLNDFNNSYVAAMREYNQAGQSLLDAKVEKMNWESDYRTWQHRQYENANAAWMANLSAALSRYIQAVNTELVQKSTQTQINSAYARARINSSKDKIAESLVNYHFATTK